MTPFTESYWPATEDMSLLETSSASVLAEAAKTWPHWVALVEAVANPAARRRWTYAELLGEAERTARALLERFAPGDHIALWGGNCAAPSRTT
jgi:fatty-acyl-CoA synthase